MNITLKLFATYQRYLPDGCEGRACDLDVGDGATVGHLLDQFHVPMEGAVILVNGRTAAQEHILEDGDVVAVFPALAGG